MTDKKRDTGAGLELDRRDLLKLGAAGVGLAALNACTPGGSGGSTASLPGLHRPDEHRPGSDPAHLAPSGRRMPAPGDPPSADVDAQAQSSVERSLSAAESDLESSEQRIIGEGQTATTPTTDGGASQTGN